MIKKPVRVMWLLNHTSARKFEVPMLKKIGIEEIFLPKIYPNDPRFRSASVDYSEDDNLTIPKNELDILNSQNWYNSPSLEAWEIANRHFDVLFFIVQSDTIIKNIYKNYKGVALWRAYGLDHSISYSKVIEWLTKNLGKKYISSLGNRFYFAGAYNHLHLIEESFIKERHLYLPLGLNNCQINDQWQGNDKKIFLVCPDLGFNPYYKEIYDSFTKDFKGLPYAIGGVQSIPVNDPNVFGFVPNDIHKRNMQELRLMFYHSTEPNHIHYHPFEAIRVGMPLVFMAGGILDRFGGKSLPGRCTTIQEARRKIERILNDDWGLINDIRKTQDCLLESMKPENCEKAWRFGFQRILDTLEKTKALTNFQKKPKSKIAVILPIGYRGGTFRGAKLVAQAIEFGSRQDGQEVDVVFAYESDPALYPEEEFADLPPSIKRRPYAWCVLSREEAKRALAYAGLEYPLNSESYIIPDDGMNQFMDCDLLIFISDRLSKPIVPIRPFIILAYDYLQRYENFLPTSSNIKFVEAAHAAERVFVTTEFSRKDAIQFAGLPNHKVIKLPILAPNFTLEKNSNLEDGKDYFLWTTNCALHKNHENTIKSLRLYYEKYNGRLECHVTGYGMEYILTKDLPHFKVVQDIVEGSSKLQNFLKILGELPDQDYQAQLSHSEFLFHSGRMDNGTFSVVEAAHLGVPSLSSDYPAMHEFDRQFSLNLTWMDPYNPEDMARQIKYMEDECKVKRNSLPTKQFLESQAVEKLAHSYWEAVRECL